MRRRSPVRIMGWMMSSRSPAAPSASPSSPVASRYSQAIMNAFSTRCESFSMTSKRRQQGSSSRPFIPARVSARTACGTPAASGKNRQQGARAKMFSHVMIGTNDLDKAKSFYDALLGTLGTKPGFVDRHRIFWRNKGGTFSVTKRIDGKDATCANGGTIGFVAESTADVDAFHKAGLANGGKTFANPPGHRESAGRRLYIAYLRDPCGNKICAVHRMAS